MRKIKKYRVLIVWLSGTFMGLEWKVKPYYKHATSKREAKQLAIIDFMNEYDKEPRNIIVKRDYS